MIKDEINNSNSSGTLLNGEVLRKREVVTSLYRYSDLSLKSIAQQVDMSLHEVQSITDELAKSDALQTLVEQRTTHIENLMSTNVISLDISKTVGDAAALMTEKKVGSVVVTKDDGKPFGIITERDLVRGLGKREELYFRATLLESFASHPLITTKPTTTVEEAAEVMFKNKIRRLPIVNEYGLVVGIVTVTDLALYLSPTRRPGLTQSVLRAISRGRNV